MEWTRSAEAELERRLRGAADSLEGDGADPGEVADDVRRHVETELEAQGATVVTADQAERLLRQMGFDEEEAVPYPPAPRRAPLPSQAKRPKGLGVGFILAGVVLPALALFVELTSRICTENFFDPLPTAGHVVLFGSIVAASLLLWIGRDGGGPGFRRLTALMLGFAIVAAGVYCVAFLPMLPISFLALLVGFGLLALAPYFALAALLGGISWLRKTTDGTTRSLGRELWIGAGLAFLLVVLLEIPPILTQRGLARAVAPDPETRARGVALLRRYGDEEEILRRCYEPERFRRGALGRRRTSTNSLLGAFGTLGIEEQGVTRQQARELYYRVTGRPFNSVPAPLNAPPSTLGFRRRFPTWEEQGGDIVAGRIPGLELASSRLDGVVDAEAAHAYLQWTMEFRNHGTTSEEARAELALPPGATVSRLTLWVNGVEREAVFGPRQRITQAYKNIVQRPRATRDPVLVRTSGPDRVLVQCFPVLPRGTLMKIRVGITAPVDLNGPDQGWVGTPHIVERNFDMPDEAIHSIWWESPAPIEGSDDALVIERPAPDVVTVRGRLTDEQLSRGYGALHIVATKPAPAAWTPDPTEPEAWTVVQHITESPASGPKAPPALALVIDGSRLMEDALDPVARFVEQLPPGVRLHVYVAREELPDTLASNVTTGPDASEEVADRIRDADTHGGCDAVPALIDACLAVGGEPGGLVVWIHGPQPVTLRPTSALDQYFERRPNGARILTTQAVGGPNRLLGVLDLYPRVSSLGRRGDLGADLDRLLATWRGDTRRWQIERRRVPAADVEPSTAGKKTSRNLAKLWARDAADALLRTAPRPDKEAAQRLATEHRIVVPVTAAVVLETDRQYVEAGLKPPTEEAVEDELMEMVVEDDPSEEAVEDDVAEMAEPELWLLVIAVGLLLLLGHGVRRRQGSGAMPT